tara:strand:- start:336 stop:584 length:249 start_codon:yes stop_codon:yes gene_type:complete
MKCKRIVISNLYGSEPTVLLGIVEDDYNFLKIKTAKRNYTIPKDRILEVSDTEEEFKEASEYGNGSIIEDFKKRGDKRGEFG